MNTISKDQDGNDFQYTDQADDVMDSPNFQRISDQQRHEDNQLSRHRKQYRQFSVYSFSFVTEMLEIDSTYIFITSAGPGSRMATDYYSTVRLVSKT